MTSPDIGILLPTRAVLLRPQPPRDLESVLTLAESVDAAGYGSVWVGDSLLASPRPEAVVTLSAVAARTRRVRIGTGILIGSLRHPLHLAHQLATIDLVSAGRLTVGIGYSSGTGPWKREHEVVGSDASTRHARTLECIEAMRRLWSTGPSDFHGEHFDFGDVDLAPKPVQPGGPPIWLHGLRGEKTLRRVAEHADGWINNLATAQEFAAGWARVREHAAALGRDPRAFRACHYSTIRLGRDGAAARSEGRRFMSAYYGGMNADEIERAECCRFGTAEEVAESLSEYIEAGATTLILRIAADEQREQLDLCSERLLPFLQRARPST